MGWPWDGWWCGGCDDQKGALVVGMGGWGQTGACRTATNSAQVDTRPPSHSPHCTALHRAAADAALWIRSQSLAAVGCCGRCSGAWVGGFRLFSGCLVCGVSSNWKGGRAGHPASQSRKGQAEVAGTPYMCVMDVTLCRRGGPMGPELRHTAPLSAQPGCHLASTWCSPSCTVYFCSLSPCP